VTVCTAFVPDGVTVSEPWKIHIHHAKSSTLVCSVGWPCPRTLSSHCENAPYFVPSE
jgi:hypothetical protein